MAGEGSSVTRLAVDNWPECGSSPPHSHRACHALSPIPTKLEGEVIPFRSVGSATGGHEIGWVVRTAIGEWNDVVEHRFLKRRFDACDAAASTISLVEVTPQSRFDSGARWAFSTRF